MILDTHYNDLFQLIMNTPEIKEVDLIKVQVIKAKHLNQLPPVGIGDYNLADFTHLAHLPQGFGLLARDKNGYLVKIDMMVVIDTFIKEYGVTLGPDTARNFANSLPQLLID